MPSFAHLPTLFYLQAHYILCTLGVKDRNISDFDTVVHCLENISFRREEGYCRICWYAASISDVDLGGKVTKGVIKVSDDIRGEINFRNLCIHYIFIVSAIFLLSVWNSTL